MRFVNSVRSWKAVGAAVILAVLCIGAASVGARNDDNSGWGEVYCLTNDPDGNELAVFARDNKGHLGNPSFVPTGGDGTGTGLGNQGALALDADGNHLYAVNPGSDSITVFRLTRSGPQVLQTVPSGGRRPVSLAVYRNLLYVLNAGGSVGDEDGIAGFAIRGNGRLLPLNGSRQRLSAKTCILYRSLIGLKPPFMSP